MVFFAPNKKKAKEYMSKTGMKGNLSLSSKQVPHSSGWKTWEVKKDEAELERLKNIKM